VTVVQYGDCECPYCGRRNPLCASCGATSRTSAPCGGTCRSQTCILTPSWRHWPRRPPPIRARSGRCTTSCSSTRRSCEWPIWCRTPTDSGSTWRASPRTCKGTLGRTGSPRMWRGRS
jgi:hypothetical protein